MADNNDWENYGWFENGSGNIGADFEQMPDLSSFNTANLLPQNVNQLLADLGNIGTDLGPASDLGMNQDLLNQIGLPNIDWENYAFYESGDKNTKDAYDRADALKADNIDVGGGYNPATGKGDKATADAALETGVTDSAKQNYGATNTPGQTISGGGIADKLKNAISGGSDKKSGIDASTMLMLMMLLSQMNKGGNPAAASVIPQLSASRSQIPYAKPSRPGAGGVSYFTPTTYSKKMAEGGIAALGGYSDGGQLLKGPGDGVSDSIPATIAGKQPARLADGEFVVPARIVSELGNGSTDAGARKLYAMMKRIEKTRKGAKNIAANTKADRHLPA